MFEFRRIYNCCKSYACVNLGKTRSDDYQALSTYLGYPALHCRACGSYPPLVDDVTISRLVEEKSASQFDKQPCGCPNCEAGFFLGNPPGVQRYGKTSAGHQRYSCGDCGKVFTGANLANEAQLTALLQRVRDGVAPVAVMDQLQVAPKIYYKQLITLYHGMRLMSRRQEKTQLSRPILGLLTESHVLQLAGEKALWLMASTDADSGYVLMLNHNLSGEDVSEEGVYHSKKSSILPKPATSSILDAITQRYQHTMMRHHFEALAYGDAKPLRGGELVQPALLAYAHFQLLRPFTSLAGHFHHYIEHESSIRGGGLISCVDEIRAGRAEVFFVYKHAQAGRVLPSHGNNIGWWSDRWYPADFGGYCPITYRKQYAYTFDLRKPFACDGFFAFVNEVMPTSLKSAKSLDALFEIYRNLFNYVMADEAGETPAMRFGVAEAPLSLNALVERMTNAVNHYYEVD